MASASLCQQIDARPITLAEVRPLFRHFEGQPRAGMPGTGDEFEVVSSTREPGLQIEEIVLELAPGNIHLGRVLAIAWRQFYVMQDRKLCTRPFVRLQVRRRLPKHGERLAIGDCVRERRGVVLRGARLRACGRE